MPRLIYPRIILIFVLSGLTSACVVKPRYPVDPAGAAKLGFNTHYIIRLGDLVNSAYSVFDRQKKERCFKPNPAFPQESTIGFEPIANIQGIDDQKLQFREFYGHVSWQLPARTTLVISIRGTSDVQEWIDDAKYSLVAYSSDPNDGKVEQGFYDIFKSMTVSVPEPLACSEVELNKTIFTPLEAFLAKLEGVQELVVVGHSLGSSIATLVALQAKQTRPNIPVKLLTFASPLTGDEIFVERFQQQIQSSVRVVNRPDVVPRVPPPFMGYQHVWHQLGIDSYPIPQVKKSMLCYHSLDTYLYVLRGQRGKLAVGCEQT